jgi:hypothetical protein
LLKIKWNQLLGMKSFRLAIESPRGSYQLPELVIGKVSLCLFQTCAPTTMQTTMQLFSLIQMGTTSKWFAASRLLPLKRAKILAALTGRS